MRRVLASWAWLSLFAVAATGCGAGALDAVVLNEDELQEEELGALEITQSLAEAGVEPVVDLDGALEEQPEEELGVDSELEADFETSDGTFPEDELAQAVAEFEALVPEEPTDATDDAAAEPTDAPDAGGEVAEAEFPAPADPAGNDELPAEPGEGGELAELEGAASSAPPPPPFQVFFNDPAGDNTRRMALETALVRLIDRASPGATIRGSWYLVSRTRVIEALTRAARRKVKVQLVLDRKGARTKAVKSALGKLPGTVRFCDKAGGGQACLGKKINHNKFLTVSSTTDGARYVVWQASANLNGGSTHENAVVIRGNKRLFDTYASYFGDLMKNPRRPKLTYNREVDAKGGVFVHFSPHSKRDHVLGTLRNVHCAKSGFRGTIRVAMAYFSGSRGEKLVDELSRLRKKGCSVEVLVADSSKHNRVSSAVMRDLKKAKFAVRRYEMGKKLAGIHSKYMLVDARYGASKVRRQLVLTGSHNWTNGAQYRNDEVLLRLANPAVYRAFQGDYVRIRRHTRPL